VVRVEGVKGDAIESDKSLAGQRATLLVEEQQANSKTHITIIRLSRMRHGSSGGNTWQEVHMVSVLSCLSISHQNIKSCPTM